jgi:predicted ATPase
MSFKVKTNWCVITGGPSSGKTSVIEEFAKRGYPTEPEVARDLIESRLKLGERIEDVRSRSEWLQNEILRLKLEHGRQQDPEKRVFLDRGIPDSLTYFRIAGLDTAAVKEASLEFHYHDVFIFDLLSLVRDGIRTESDIMAGQIDIALEKDYRDIGYSPIRVPVMPITDRADFILQAIRK